MADADLVDHYRLNAEKCLQLAQTFNDLDAKRPLLVMANAWLMLAARREENISPDIEPPQRLSSTTDDDRVDR